jgi:adenine C2-methylase RlmN of 23S rRNA A2503 and tRNA A37
VAVSPAIPSEDYETLSSDLDASVNFIHRDERPGAIEARYVRRQERYFIVYLSSQTGCNKACRFCHLTQSGQTQGVDLNLQEYCSQAQQVFGHYDTLLTEGSPSAETVHFNFMSRGEVFANPIIHSQADDLLDLLQTMAEGRNLQPLYKFSTIMPVEMKGVKLTDLFQRHRPDIYYSLYSTDEAWRKRWMPKALPSEEALKMLVEWQNETGLTPVLHWALIKAQNDTVETVEAIIQAISDKGLKADFNLVRYNPFSSNQGEASSEDQMTYVAQSLAQAFTDSRVQIVGRVGHDVKASCGMFVEGTNTKEKKAEILRNLPVLDSTQSRMFQTGEG